MLFRKKVRKTVKQRTPDTKPFVIPQIEPKEEKKYQRDQFVSPVFGRKAKDEIVIPNSVERKGDYDLQYDSFRTEPKLTKEERIKKYGSEFPEFDLIKGSNLNEALDFQNKRTKAKINEPEETRPIESKPYKNHEHVEEIYPNIDVEKPKTSINDFFEEELEEVIEEPVNETVEELVEEPVDNSVEEYIEEESVKEYILPPYSLLNKPHQDKTDSTDEINHQIDVLNRTFEEFKIGAKVIKNTKGPTVTRYEIMLESGVNVKKVTNIADNLKMALAAKEIRIEAPIPGKSTVGIEVPNLKPEIVHFIDIVDNDEFKKSDDILNIALGLDIDGQGVYTSIAKMPHGLVAGATGSGKSVCINTILMSLLFKYTPDELKLMLIDPKMVELSSYNDIPHLLTPVITDAKIATAGLKWAVEEMERRFVIFSNERVRDIGTYNHKINHEDRDDTMPYIVIIVDELADLMMVASSSVEEAIMRLTQKARACGIHLIIATQRPSTDVVKGTIKSNIPTRIAFSVSSYIDSMTIIDSAGADKLLGRGDMLFAESGQPQIRVQGAYISDMEINNVNEFIRKQREPEYFFTQDKLVKKAASSDNYDELTEEVAKYVVIQEECSINKISKEFKIGFNRAQKIVESLSEMGVVSQNLGSKARTVNVDMQELEAMLNE